MGLAQMNSQWVEGAMVHIPHRRVILDIDSSESPMHGQQGGNRLQRPLRVCLLSSSLSVQLIRGLRSSDATTRERP